MTALIEETVVLNDSVRFYEYENVRGELVEINVMGRVETTSGAILSVNKWLEVGYPHGSRISVRTREYSYHAHVRTAGARADVFRYDNCHGGMDTLHRHAYDDEGAEAGDPAPIAADQMPPLNIVIREAEFYAVHLARLP